jgi:uncharacterized delta-60 repeat protein
MRFRGPLATSVVALSIFTTQLIAQSSPGAYDLTWGGSARVRVNFNDHVLTNASAYDTVIQAPSVAEQADANFRKIVVFGSSDEGTRPHFAAVRLNINGTRDMGWGANNAISGSGSYGVIKEVDLGTWDTITNGVRQPDNKVLMLGYISLVPQAPPNNQTEDWRLVRYTANGDRDTTFGWPNKDGVVVFNIKGTNAGAARTNGIALDSDGNIYCVGYTNTNSDAQIEVWKLDKNGVPDNTFDGDGHVVLNPNVNVTDQAWGVDIQTLSPNIGKVVIAGRANGRPFVARLNTNGSLDTGFGSGGYTYVNAAPFQSGFDYFRGMLVDASDRVVGVGKFSGICNNNTSNQAMIARFTPNGTLDTSFNGVGYTTLAVAPFTFFQRVIEQPDGKYVASGDIGPICLDNTRQIGAYRYNTNGTIDTSFGVNGMALADVVPGQNSEISRGIALQPDGGLLVSGEGIISNLVHMFVARFNSAGVLDTEFNKNGQIVTSLINVKGVFATRLTGSSADFSYGTMVQADGKVVQVGTTWNGWDYDFGIARYTTEGVFDTTFGDDDPDYADPARHLGRTVLDTSAVAKVVGVANNPDKTDTAFAVARQSDGKIIVAGQVQGQAGSAVLKLFRLTTTGALDNTFGTSGYVTGSANYRPRAVIVDASNNIYVTGDISNGFSSLFVQKYNASGGSPVERTFSRAASTFNESHSIALQPDGKIVIGGRYAVNGSPFQMLVGRLNTDLTIDNTFSLGRQIFSGGALIEDPAYMGIFPLPHETNRAVPTAGTPNPIGTALSTNDQGEWLVVEVDGKILLGGRTIPTTPANARPRYGLARLTPAGRFDATYGSAGWVATDFAPADVNLHDSDIYSLQLQNDGQVIAMGTAGLINNYDFAAARYNFDNGSLDTAFNTTGLSTMAIGQGMDIATSGAITATGQAVLGGYDTLREDFIAVRWQGDNPPLGTTNPTGQYTVAPVLTPASDTSRPNYAAGPTDKITNNSAPTLTGSPCIAGESVILRVFNQTTNVEQNWHPRFRCRAASNNVYTATVPAYAAINGTSVGNLPDGTYKIQAYAATGNGSTTMSPFITDIVIDTFAAVPTIGSPVANESRDVEQAMTFSGGGAETNAFVTIYDTTTVTRDNTTGVITAGATTLCSAVANASGNWTCNVAANFFGVATLGLRKLQAQQQDIAGNFSKFCKAGVGTCASTDVQFFAKAHTTTSIVSSVNPARYFQPFTLTTQVRSNIGTPDGVTANSVALIYDTNAVAIPNTLDISGNAPYAPTLPQTVAFHTLSSAYNGSTKYFSSATTAPFQQEVIKADTAIAESSTANPSVFGQSVSVTGVLSVVAPGGGVPSGTLTYTLDANAPVSGTTFTSNTLSVAPHTVKFDYAGDTNYNLSTQSLTQTVNKASTTSTVTASVNPAVFGQSGTLTVKVAVVSPGSGSVTAPTGNVDVLIDGASIGTVAPSVAGTTINYPTLDVGTHIVSVSYPGDGNFLTSTGSLAGGLVINKASVTLVITRAPTASVTTEHVTYTATLTAAAPGAGTPGGTVTFVDDDLQSCIANLTAGQGNCVLRHEVAGTKTVTGTYSGDASFNGKTGTTSHVVSKASTTTVFVSKDLTTSLVGQPVEVFFTSSVTAPGEGAPVTLATVSAGADSCTVIAATGHCAITFTSAGTKSIAINYPGDSNFFGSSASPVSHDVTKASTTTTLTDTRDPSVVGEAVVMHYTVPVDAPGGGTPTGNVTVSDGTSNCTGTVAAAQCTITYATVGQRTLTATYAGDANFTGSTSPSATHDVTLGQVAVTIISRTPATSVTGQSVVVAWTALPIAPSTGTPTGTVTVTSGADSCSAAVGAGSCTIVLRSAGNRALDAVYSGDANFDPATGSANQVVTAAATSTAINSHDANPSIRGEGVIVIATVASSAPGTGIPTGSVVVSAGTDNCTITLSAGTGQCTLTFLSAGSKTITAAYQADGNYAASSTTAAHTVNKASTTATLTNLPATSLFGQTVTITATIAIVAPGAGAPTGTVNFLDNGGAISGCSAIAVASNAATCTTSALSVGTHANITATYSGAADFNGSTASAVSQAVNLSDSSVAIVSSINPSIIAQSITLTATVAAVAPGVGTPTGTVTFLDGGNSLGTGPLVAGVATLSTGALAVGNHTITATYAGDTNFNGSAGSMTGNPQVVNKGSTATTLTSSQNPSILGQSVTFTATLSAVSPASGTPTGLITFKDGGNSIGTGTLAGGVATFTTTALAVGSHTITTSYGGDASFTNTGTGTLTGNPQVVNKGNTTIAAVSSINPSTFGQAVTFTATVAAVAPTTGTPTGTVTFLDGASSIGSGTLSGGIATFTTSALASGNHTINVAYGGDGNFNTSNGAIAGNPQVVSKANSTTTLTSSANPSVFGQPVTFTATIALVAPGAGLPTGTVTFLSGGNSIGTGTLSAGVATFTTSSLAVSAVGYTITTTYTGDSNVNGSNGSMTGNPQIVNKSGSAITLAPSVNPAVIGQPVTFTATVSAVVPGAGTPTGTVTFLDGANPIGSSPLTAGSATLVVPSLAVGSHTITITYAGDGNFNTSSGALTGNPEIVGKGSTATVLVSSQNASVRGQSVTYTATLSAVAPATGTPGGTVTFMDGATTLGTGTLAGGVATFATSALTVGSHTISTTYGGDGNFNAGGTGSLTGNPQVVNKGNTTVSAVASVNPSISGQSVTFTATVAVTAPASGTATGTVTFLDGATSIGTGTLSGGVATFATAALTTASHTINVSYGGDGNFNTSAGALTGNPQVVNKANSAMTLTSSANPSVFGQPVTFTAVVSRVAPASGPVTGIVTFLSGGSTIGSGALSGGVATFTTPSLAVSGAGYTITATYAGDSNVNAGSGSMTGNPQVVNKAASATTVVSSINPAVVLQSITFTATVSAVVPGAGTPSGIVTFLDGGIPLGTGPLSGGVATLATTSLVSGLHTITTTYAGDGNFNGSNGSLTSNPQVINKKSATITITSSLNSSRYGQDVVFTATLLPVAPATETPTGTLTFFDGTTSLASTSLTNGVATFATSTLVGGLHPITALYGGDANFNGGTGSLSGKPQRVISPVGDFDGDGRSDLIWRNLTTSETSFWLMDGGTVKAGSGLTFLQVPDNSLLLAGTGDFNGDGKADLLWRRAQTGETIVWLMSGVNTIAGSGSLSSVPLPWQIAAIGDFNGDGNADIVWRNLSTGEMSVWLMNGTSVLSGSGPLPTLADLHWHTAGVGDFNGDGRADILWRDDSAGQTMMWMMNGSTVLVDSGSTSVQIPSDWRATTVGDFNGDGFADVLWRNLATGDTIAWLMNGTAVINGSGFVFALPWKWNSVASGDFNGDGNTDLIWRDETNGATLMWFMNGTAVLPGSGVLATVPAPWTVSGPR